MFETGTQVNIEANLDEIIDHVNIEANLKEIIDLVQPHLKKPEAPWRLQLLVNS